jgi:hypothetical protein
MMSAWSRAVALAVVLGATPAYAAPGDAAKPDVAKLDAAKPDAATLLFETPQLTATKPNDTLVYDYRQTNTNPQLFGPDVTDSIRLTVDPSPKADARTLRVQLFTGARHRAAGPFENVTGNPVLSLFLEHHVQALAQQLHANPRYLKNAIRAALRDKAAVTATEVTIAGRTLPGWRVRITPFVADPNKARMAGLDGLAYEFTVADGVPGDIAEIRVSAPGGNGKTLFEETLTYDPTAS